MDKKKLSHEVTWSVLLANFNNEEKIQSGIQILQTESYSNRREINQFYQHCEFASFEFVS